MNPYLGIDNILKNAYFEYDQALGGETNLFPYNNQQDPASFDEESLDQHEYISSFRAEDSSIPENVNYHTGNYNFDAENAEIENKYEDKEDGSVRSKFSKHSYTLVLMLCMQFIYKYKKFPDRTDLLTSAADHLENIFKTIGNMRLLQKIAINKIHFINVSDNSIFNFLPQSEFEKKLTTYSKFFRTRTSKKPNQPRAGASNESDNIQIEEFDHNIQIQECINNLQSEIDRLNQSIIKLKDYQNEYNLILQNSISITKSTETHPTAIPTSTPSPQHLQTPGNPNENSRHNSNPKTIELENIDLTKSEIIERPAPKTTNVEASNETGPDNSKLNGQLEKKIETQSFNIEEKKNLSQSKMKISMVILFAVISVLILFYGLKYFRFSDKIHSNSKEL